MEELWILIQRLPQEEKKVLRARLTEEESAQEALAPYTMEEIIQGIEEAEASIEKGELINHDDVQLRMRERINEIYANKNVMAYAS